ncbi:hypothetical protein EAI_08941 [Harpegnathos saltator]|uniref:Uncharacterized protein n=1 Tax=Harpegnathos saltator TaxID=610380 RepID=E2BYI7_HARSA|nr:hypothetical protein EAI_08941 [Harpegnathos saltator]
MHAASRPILAKVNDDQLGRQDTTKSKLSRRVDMNFVVVTASSSVRPANPVREVVHTFTLCLRDSNREFMDTRLPSCNSMFVPFARIECINLKAITAILRVDVITWRRKIS